jgi:hypothetical protein
MPLSGESVYFEVQPPLLFSLQGGDRRNPHFLGGETEERLRRPDTVFAIPVSPGGGVDPDTSGI